MTWARERQIILLVIQKELIFEFFAYTFKSLGWQRWLTNGMRRSVKPTSKSTAVDDREDYREPRELALAFIGVRLHMLVFTRRGDNIRIISLRKAEKQEVRDYAKKIPR